MNHKPSKLLTMRWTKSCGFLLLALAFLAILASTGPFTLETFFKHVSLNSSSSSISQRPLTTPASPNETRARLARSYG